MNPVIIDYTNWRGVRSLRKIVPRKIDFGSNEWHPEPQWLLTAYNRATSPARWPLAVSAGRCGRKYQWPLSGPEKGNEE